MHHDDDDDDDDEDDDDDDDGHEDNDHDDDNNNDHDQLSQLQLPATSLLIGSQYWHGKNSICSSFPYMAELDI